MTSYSCEVAERVGSVVIVSVLLRVKLEERAEECTLQREKPQDVHDTEAGTMPYVYAHTAATGIAQLAVVCLLCIPDTPEVI